MNTTINLKNRKKPTEEEARKMLRVPKDYLEHGGTSIRCPRCEKPLELFMNEGGKVVMCSDKNCLAMTFRGL